MSYKHYGELPLQESVSVEGGGQDSLTADTHSFLSRASGSVLSRTVHMKPGLPGALPFHAGLSSPLSSVRAVPTPEWPQGQAQRWGHTEALRTMKGALG